MIRKVLAFAAVAAGVMGAWTGTAVSADYYAGKTLTFIVGYDPGGGTDTNWRAIADHFGKHVPGRPDVVVQNMSGGSGNIAASFVYERARKDGLTLLTGPWNALGALTGAPGMRIDYNKMVFIGGFAGPNANFVRTDVIPGGLKDPKDIVKAKMIKVAGLRPDSNLDLMSRLSLDLLGVPYKYITGYKGAAQRRVAVQAGEADMTSIGYNEFRAGIEPTAVKEGTVIGLYYHGFEPLPYITNMMDFPSFYKAVKGAPPSGPHWDLLAAVYNAIGIFQNAMMAPPGTPKEATEALRIGWQGLMKDKEFEQVAIKRFGEAPDWATWEQGRKAIDALLGKPDPKLVQNLKAYIAAGSK